MSALSSVPVPYGSGKKVRLTIFHAVLTLFQRRRTCDAGQMVVGGAHLVWVEADFSCTLSESIHNGIRTQYSQIVVHWVSSGVLTTCLDRPIHCPHRPLLAPTRHRTKEAPKAIIRTEAAVTGNRPHHRADPSPS